MIRRHRIEHGFRNRRNRSFVNYKIRAAKRIRKTIPIGDIQFENFDVTAERRDIDFLSGRKIVDDSNGLVVTKQCLRNVRANKSSSTGNHVGRHETYMSNLFAEFRALPRFRVRKLGFVVLDVLGDTTMKVLNVVGARPNFMKIAPIVEQMKKTVGITDVLVHTGQHYDEEMSGVFFRDLGIPCPDIDLGIGSGSHAIQTARIMTAFEKVCIDEKPDLVVVVGDVNSTMACTLVAAKLQIRVAHVEAGLRSNDRSMPEEINRIVT